jgi:hypothetical protein
MVVQLLRMVNLWQGSVAVRIKLAGISTFFAIQ